MAVVVAMPLIATCLECVMRPATLLFGRRVGLCIRNGTMANVRHVIQRDTPLARQRHRSPTELKR